MRLTLSLPVMNQLNDTKSALGTFRYNTSENSEWLVIDNGSTDKYEDFLLHYLRPRRLNYVRNEENIGLVKTMQQAYENCETEILALSHNDVFVYEKDWDQRIIAYFEKMPDLGAIGFFGAQGCGPKGERIQDVPSPGVMSGFSNMLEAEIHGFRLQEDWKPAAIFDGFMMIFRMEMLKKGNGFDTQYIYHHIYDRDASLESLRRGYKNIVVNVPCHHIGGITANRAEYQEWINKKITTPDFSADKLTHDTNSETFAEKFKDVLPLYVENDFSYRTGSADIWNFKGDAIRKMKNG